MNAKLATALLTVVVLSGCNAISPTECLYGDWYARGQAAKSEGLNMGELMRQQSACASHGIQPNRGEFIAGYRGLARTTDPG